MTTLRDAAQQALEALCLWATGRDMDAVALNDLILRLEAALAEPVQDHFPDATKMVQEPVAWMVYTEGGASAYVTDNPRDLIGAYRALPLYAAPPQRLPLTDEEIDAEWRKAASEEGFTTAQFVRNFVRAIERAHGIGDKDGPQG